MFIGLRNKHKVFTQLEDHILFIIRKKNNKSIYYSVHLGFQLKVLVGSHTTVGVLTMNQQKLQHNCGTRLTHLPPPPKKNKKKHGNGVSWHSTLLIFKFQRNFYSHWCMCIWLCVCLFLQNVPRVSGVRVLCKCFTVCTPMTNYLAHGLSIEFIHWFF